MTYYLRVMLGAKSVHAEECIKNSFVGTDFDFKIDLTSYLKDTWGESKKELSRIYKELRPEKTPIGVGLNCGSLYTVSKGIPIGGVVISPTGKGDYIYGEVVRDYEYVPNSPLPHQRPVQWSQARIRKEDMSESLVKALTRPLTTIDLNPYAVELDELIGKRDLGPRVSVNDVNVEDASRFALEAILEDFLVANWEHTTFAQNYEILSDAGVLVGQQFPADKGIIDILAISKDGNEYLVLELKRGKAKDVVVGQLLRYMGYIKREYCQDGKKVKGAIVAHEDDLGIRDALSMVSDVEFYKYEIDFKLNLQ